ncbi:MAG: DpnII family type II restriction endonuclease [Candidatus Methanomethyliaceae archaeon]
MSKDELIEKFVSKLLITNRSFNFYVNWDNIEDYKEFEVELHAMDILIKNNDFDNAFKKLIKKLPTVVATFPYLFALSKSERQDIYRGKDKLIIANSNIGEEDNLEYYFSLKTLEKGLTDEQIENYLFFFENMGLKHLFMNLVEKSVTDYVIGVLVGLDTNGRKNRGGYAFELACYPIIEKLCLNYGIELIMQKQFKILKEYGFIISDDISERKADFILIKNNKCLNIEVNYFNGPGSKPEEIIDSYITRQNQLNKDKIDFAFITDGKNCWGNVEKSQLLKAFRNIKYFMNFNLAKEGMLEEVIKEIFLESE